MADRTVSAIRSVSAAVSLLGFVVAFVVAGPEGSSLPVVVGSAVVGAIALAIAAGPHAILALFGVGVDPGDVAEDGQDGRPAWWLARFEPVVEDVWDRQADYALAGGLAVVGVAALAVIATRSGDDPPLRLLVLGLLCLNGALVALAGASITE